MKTLSLTLGMLLVSASSLSTSLAQSGPDQPPPPELRERIGQLTEKARDLKTAGRHEDALRIMREAEELEVQAMARREASETDGRQEEFRPQMRASRAEGRERQIAVLKERLAQLQREGDRPGPGPGRADRPRAERPGNPGPTPPRREGLDGRMRHFELAIENLHAAGLHEMAERLAGERERVAQRLDAGPGPAVAVREELGRLHAQLDELREGMERLKGRVEELHRDAPKR